MTWAGAWHLFADRWFMSLTMAFGSFVAGATSEGVGAVAFPVMTLIFRIPPEVARNFSLAIQSVGMTAAAYLILRRRIPIEIRYLIPCSLGGGAGIVLGTFLIVPQVPSPYAKMLFVTVWLSFACVLFYTNHVRKRQVKDRLPVLPAAEVAGLVFVGVLGGCLSANVGSGIDILSFSYVTMRFGLCEKVATPTSVIIMAGNAMIGLLLHAAVLGDVGAEAFNYWLVCVPVVVFGAPLGAYFISRRNRLFVAKCLYVIIVVQFIGAWWTLRPAGSLLMFALTVFAVGLAFFFAFERTSAQRVPLRSAGAPSSNPSGGG
jgi:uncharacterized membrane protein YfcA